ncbi:MAG: hypothetical protein AB8B79_14245 [Granulosicoccus sp.]
MIAKALQVFFFWRRNNLPSIVFKSAVWSLIAWLAVGMFTNLKLALIAGACIGVMSAIKYGLQKRKETAKLLAMVGGDPEKYRALRAKLDMPGMGGTLMREMLNAELSDDEDDYDDEELEELSDEQRQQNIENTKLQISRLKSICLDEKLASLDHCDEAELELMESYGDGEETVEMEQLIEAFLPDNSLGFCAEDYINEGDHASLVESFSDATNGRWVIEDCTSHFDESAQRWVVSFTENGKSKSWKFAQQGDWLNEKFLDQLIKYTEVKSGYSITVLDSEDFVSLVCLPPSIHAALIDDDQLDQAA